MFSAKLKTLGRTSASQLEGNRVSRPNGYFS